MTTIAPDQLPAPRLGSAPPPPPTQWAPAAPSFRAAAAPRRRASSLLGAVALVAIVGVGTAVAALAVGKDGDATASERSDQRGGSGSADVGVDLDDVYEQIFAVRAGDDVVDCVADQLGDDTAALQSMIAGETVSIATAQDVYRPFMRCAPDEDFAGTIAIATARVTGIPVDEACIADLAEDLTTGERAYTHALAYVDPAQFETELVDHFGGCTV